MFLCSNWKLSFFDIKKETLLGLSLPVKRHSHFNEFMTFTHEYLLMCSSSLLLRNVCLLPSTLRSFFCKVLLTISLCLVVLMHAHLVMRSFLIRSHLFSLSRFPCSLTTCKLPSSIAQFGSFKRFLITGYFSVLRTGS